MSTSVELQATRVSFLTKKEVASLFRVTERTINLWLNQGTISGKKVGSKVLFEEQDVLASIKDIPAKEAVLHE